MTGDEKVTKIKASLQHRAPHIVSIDGSLGRIETDLAALSCNMPRLPRALPLLWLTLAASVTLLAVCAVG